MNLTFLPSISPPPYEEYAKVIIEEGVKIVETAGGPAASPIIKILKQANLFVIHKVCWYSLTLCCPDDGIPRRWLAIPPNCDADPLCACSVLLFVTPSLQLRLGSTCCQLMRSNVLDILEKMMSEDLSCLLWPPRSFRSLSSRVVVSEMDEVSPLPLLLVPKVSTAVLCSWPPRRATSTTISSGRSLMEPVSRLLPSPSVHQNDKKLTHFYSAERDTAHIFRTLHNTARVFKVSDESSKTLHPIWGLSTETNLNKRFICSCRTRSQWR